MSDNFVYLVYYLNDPEDRDPANVEHYGCYKSKKDAIEFCRSVALKEFRDYSDDCCYDSESESESKKPEVDEEFEEDSEFNPEKENLVYLFRYREGVENFCVQKLKLS